MAAAFAIVLLGGSPSVSALHEDAAQTAYVMKFWNDPDVPGALFPTAWACAGLTDPASIAEEQRVLQFHTNWHCSNPTFDSDLWGARFLGFHKQFIHDFELYRDQEAWAPAKVEALAVGSPNWIIPDGHDSPALTPGFDLSSGSASVNPGTRPDGLACLNFAGGDACDGLPLVFRVPSLGGSLNTFASTGALGRALDGGTGGPGFSFHGSGHGNIGCLTPTCSGVNAGDMARVFASPRDPAFWRWHKAIDDVHVRWQELQATDVVIVIDRSGSMNDNCPGTPPTAPGVPTEAPCKIDDALDAARLFVDLLGADDNFGVVTFANTASVALVMTPGGAGALAAFDGAVVGVAALTNLNRRTGIGAGLALAQDQLETLVNSHRKAILLLTDGKENEDPCLQVDDNCGPAALTSADLPTSTEVCSVGFGGEADLDGEILRDLVEVHGGIYIADSDVDDALQLRKFFVTCFGQLSDTFAIDDPFGFLPAAATSSLPFPFRVLGDSEVTFVLSYNDPDAPRSVGDLILNATTPSGSPVILSDPAVESSIEPFWHIVRVPLPYVNSAGVPEADGEWTVRVVRPPNTRGAVGQRFFVTALVEGMGRVIPRHAWFHDYTGRDLYPRFWISPSDLPLGGFDSVTATVSVTRPLVGTGNLLHALGLPVLNATGDVHARADRLTDLNVTVPTDTSNVTLYDDGANGDALPDNSYWSSRILGTATVEGHYVFQATFEISYESQTFRRYAEYSIVVEVGIDPFATLVTKTPLGLGADQRYRTVIEITPRDRLGNYLGPGRIGSFEVTPLGDAVIESGTEDGYGTYIFVVSWTRAAGEPELKLTQNGRRIVYIRPTADACSRSQGHWKTHGEAWPTDSLFLGDRSYMQADLLRLLGMPSRGDASIILARQLIAAKLNVMNGAEGAGVAAVAAEGDALLSGFGVALPYEVKPSTASGQRMTTLASALDEYNNRPPSPDCEEVRDVGNRHKPQDNNRGSVGPDVVPGIQGPLSQKIAGTLDRPDGNPDASSSNPASSEPEIAARLLEGRTAKSSIPQAMGSPTAGSEYVPGLGLMLAALGAVAGARAVHRRQIGRKH